MILFTAPPLSRLDVDDRAVGGAGGEVANTIACGEVSMDEEGVMPPQQEMKTVLKPKEWPQRAKETSNKLQSK